MRISSARLFTVAVLICIWAVSLWAGNLSIWPLAILAGGALVFAFWQSVGLLRAFPLGYLVLLGSFAALIQISPRFPWEFDYVISIFLSCIYFGVLIWFLLVPPGFHIFRNFKRHKPLLAITSILLVIWLVSLALLYSPTTPSLSWAMREDSVWNMISSRNIVADSGIDPEVHPHSSPLTAALFAAAMVFGRSAVGGQELLLHDVQSSASMWVTWVIFGALFSAMIAWNKVSKMKAIGAFLAMGFVAFIPLSWFVAGKSFHSGYSNVSLSISIVFAIWLVWSQSEKNPVFVFTGLVFGAIALLSAWGPLAAMPLSLLAIWVFSILRRREFWKFSVLEKIWVSFLVVALGLFGLGVSIPNFLREGKYLSADGGMFYYTPLLYLGVVVLALYLAWRFSRKTSSFIEFQGILLTAAATGGVIFILVFKRRYLGEIWGYYPAKMAWVISAFLVVVIVSFLFYEISTNVKKLWIKFVSSVVVVVGTVGVMMSFLTPGSGTVPYVFPLYGLVTHEGASSTDSYVTEISEHASPDRKHFVYQYVSPSVDHFMNLWLLQLQSKDGADPIRTHAYYFGEGMLYKACEINDLWGGNSILITSSAVVADEVKDSCGTDGPGVEVHSLDAN